VLGYQIDVPVPPRSSTHVELVRAHHELTPEDRAGRSRDAVPPGADEFVAVFQGEAQGVIVGVPVYRQYDER
jgi:hypothetical protein